MQEYDVRFQAAKHYADYHGMDIHDTFKSEDFLRLWNDYVNRAQGIVKDTSRKGASKTEITRNLGVSF